MLDYARARQTMVDCQLRTFDITDRAVLAAMGEVAREAFVPPGQRDLAYTDREMMLLPGADGASRAMLAPMVLGRLIQALRIEAGQPVLDVGCGYGYSATILARLGAAVTALESAGELVGAARERVGGTVDVHEGPLAEGVATAAPFSRILVNGALERRPDTLLDQLGEGGRLACVMGGDGRAGKAVMFVRSSGGIGITTLFDAHGPLLAEFRNEPAFVF